MNLFKLIKKYINDKIINGRYITIPKKPTPNVTKYKTSKLNNNIYDILPAIPIKANNRPVPNKANTPEPQRLFTQKLKNE